MLSLKIILPIPPNRANARGHWTKHMAQRDKYYRECDGTVIDCGIVVYGFKTIKQATWTAHFCFHDHKPMDFDNLVARLKWPFDYLKSRRIIADDNATVFWPSELPKQSFGHDTPHLAISLLVK